MIMIMIMTMIMIIRRQVSLFEQMVASYLRINAKHMQGICKKKFSPLNNTAAILSFLPLLEDQVFQMADCISCLVLEYLSDVNRSITYYKQTGSIKLQAIYMIYKNYAFCVLYIAQTKVTLFH